MSVYFSLVENISWSSSSLLKYDCSVPLTSVYVRSNWYLVKECVAVARKIRCVK